VKAHIVGGGFGGLAAAGYLIRNVGVPGPDITIYEADERMGGGFFLGGSSQTGYNLPGSVLTTNSAAHSPCLMLSRPHGIRLFQSRRNSSLSMRATRSRAGVTSSTAKAASCTARVSA
jgi:cation diffusion facilitator CzcD-associated flavoprotein CzcO